MGLDIEVVETENDVDLHAIFAALDATRDGLNLHQLVDEDGPIQRQKKMVELVRGMTKDRLFSEVGRDGQHDVKEAMEVLDHVPASAYGRLIGMAADAMSKCPPEDTQFYDVYDHLPLKSIMWSCSWVLRSLLMRCRTCSGNGSYGDYVVELDRTAVLALAKRWRRAGWRLALARWVGYFNPEAAERMVADIAQQMDVSDTCLDIQDLRSYRYAMLEILKKHGGRGRRMWLTSSY